jgi:hypothetical protein
MTNAKKNKVITLYKEGVSLDCIWTMAGCKTRDESLAVIKEYRWDTFIKTGEKV